MSDKQKIIVGIGIGVVLIVLAFFAGTWCSKSTMSLRFSDDQRQQMGRFNDGAMRNQAPNASVLENSTSTTSAPAL